MTPRRRTFAAVAALAAALALGACSSGSGSGPDRHSSTPGAPDATAPGGTSTTPSSGAGSGTGTNSGSSTGTGAPYPTSGPVASPQADQTGVLNSLPGSASVTCAEVGSQRQLRAGSVAAGDFTSARAAIKARPAATKTTAVSLFVIPQRMTGVTQAVLTVTALQGQAAVSTVVSRTLSQADAWTYFPVSVSIGAEGPYRIAVVAGANRGCFDVTF